MVDPVDTELIAVVTAVTGGEPRVLTIRGGCALPSGSFETSHRSLQAGLRSWVERQTHQPLGYVEQLYTFADGDRAETAGRVLSISYLALTRENRGHRRAGRMAELVPLLSMGGSPQRAARLPGRHHPARPGRLGRR